MELNVSLYNMLHVLLTTIGNLDSSLKVRIYLYFLKDVILGNFLHGVVRL